MRKETSVNVMIVARREWWGNGDPPTSSLFPGECPLISVNRRARVSSPEYTAPERGITWGGVLYNQDRLFDVL